MQRTTCKLLIFFFRKVNTKLLKKIKLINVYVAIVDNYEAFTTSAHLYSEHLNLLFPQINYHPKIIIGKCFKI